jgi:hypothetical protein
MRVRFVNSSITVCVSQVVSVLSMDDWLFVISRGEKRGLSDFPLKVAALV